MVYSLTTNNCIIISTCMYIHTLPIMHMHLVFAINYTHCTFWIHLLCWFVFSGQALKLISQHSLEWDFLPSTSIIYPTVHVTCLHLFEDLWWKTHTSEMCLRGIHAPRLLTLQTLRLKSYTAVSTASKQLHLRTSKKPRLPDQAVWLSLFQESI